MPGFLPPVSLSASDNPSPDRRRAGLRPILAALVTALALAAAALPSSGQAPASSGAPASQPVVDPTLIRTASQIVYKRERERAGTNWNLDRGALGRARRVGERLLPMTVAMNPEARSWLWGIAVETRPEPVAWCLPTGEIVVSTGLLQLLSTSDAELAAVLAHLIAHQLAGDDIRALVAAYPKATEPNPPDPNLVAAEMAEPLAKLMLAPHYDAASEAAADRLAMEMLARSNVDPAAVFRAWEKIGRSGARNAPALAALHPVTPERLANLQKGAAELKPVYEEAAAAAAAAPKVSPNVTPPPKKSRSRGSQQAPVQQPK